jgi:protein-L-isoaspartate(D-aspartate) O-methyltransferase
MSASPACLNMIKQQLRTNNVLDETILSMYLEPTRSQFIPESFQSFAYVDTHITLTHEQVMLTPLEEAKILDSGAFKPNQSVLEIGTGTGFMSYLLSRLCEHVTSMDIFPDFTENASALLKSLNVKNVQCITHDANETKKFSQAFDAIICTSGIEFIPTHWLQWLKPEAKIFAPIGHEVQNGQWLMVKDQKIIGHEIVFQTHLPMLIHHQQSKFVF